MALQRFEIPESIWESYDRMDPKKNIELTKSNGEAIHLNEVVKLPNYVLYDGPGDFQLIERNDLFEMCGFDEEMLLGWHVDSNISKRLFLKHGTIGDALPFIFGYHCDHTRQITPMHKHKSPENDMNRFVWQCNDYIASHQKDSWGLNDVEIEEYSLKSNFTTRVSDVIKKTIDNPQLELTNSSLIPETFDRESASPKHIYPFLIDLISSMRNDLQIVWLGEIDELFNLFKEGVKNLKFSKEIIIFSDKDIGYKEFKDADCFICNFGMSHATSPLFKEEIFNSYLYLIELENIAIDQNKVPRKFITINAMHSTFETLITSTIIAAKTPYSLRLRHGFIDKDFLSNINKISNNDPAKKFFYTSETRSKILAKLRETKLISFSKKIINILFWRNSITRSSVN